MIRGLASLVIVLALAGCGGAVVPPASEAPAGTPAAQALAPGTYTSTAFQPPLTYTVPTGWTLETDTSAYLQLRPVDSDVVGIHLFRDVSAASQDPTCPMAVEPGVGKSSTELVTWIRSLKGLSVSAPVMVEIGGLRGVGVDLAIAAGWSQSCSFANGIPTVPLLTDGVTLRWVVAGSERLKVYVLDVPGGGSVIVDLDAFDGDFYESLLAGAGPIVKSFQFKSG